MQGSVVTVSKIIFRFEKESESTLWIPMNMGKNVYFALTIKKKNLT